MEKNLKKVGIFFFKFFGISCKLLTQEKKLFPCATFAREITEPLRKTKIWEKMCCINGCMVMSNLLISLVPYSIIPYLESNTCFPIRNHHIVFLHLCIYYSPFHNWKCPGYDIQKVAYKISWQDHTSTLINIIAWLRLWSINLWYSILRCYLPKRNTVRNRWEKLEHKGKAIFDIPCWKYEKYPGSPLGSTS